MTDYVLSASNQATMYATFQAIGFIDIENNICTQGLFEDGTEWALLDVGKCEYLYTETVTNSLDNKPQYISDDKYWCVLRWNGNKDISFNPDIKIEWKSNNENLIEYPIGLPRFA